MKNSAAMRQVLRKSQEFLAGVVLLILCNAFTQIFAQQPAPAKNFLNEALAHYSKRDFNSLEKAADILVTGLADQPENISAQALLASIHAHSAYLAWQTGNKDTTMITDAAERAEAAYNLEPQNPYVLKARGRILLLKGSRAEAGKMFEQALGISTNDAEAWYLYACASEGSFFDAETNAYKRVMKSIELEPGFLWAVTDILSMSLENKEYEAAKEWLAVLGQSHAESGEYLFYRGLLELHEKKTEEAKTTLGNFVKKSPESPLAAFVQKGLEK